MSAVGDVSSRDPRLPFPPLGRNAMLLILTGVAGSVDAISYLGLGHVFTANMTGNTVLLGLAIGQGQGLAALRSLVALGGFVLGVALGALIVQSDRADWPRVVTVAISLEGGILAIFAITWTLTGSARSEGIESVLIALSALAMGLQSVAVRHLGIAGIVTTYITGTWMSFVEGLISRLHPAENSSVPTSPGMRHNASASPKPRGLGLQAAVLLVYGLAAVVSGFGESRWSSGIAFVPLVVVALVAINAYLRHWSQSLISP